MTDEMIREMTDEMIREMAKDLADKIEVIMMKSMRKEIERECVAYIKESIKELKEES